MRYYWIDKRNSSVVFSFDYANEIVRAIKKCGFSARYNQSLKQWRVTVNTFTKPIILNIIKKYGFIQKPYTKPIFEKFDYSISIEKNREIKKWSQEKDFAYPPRDYQIESLYYGLEKQNFINGEDIGCGKTFEAILLAEYTNSFPCLVIVPASVKYNWMEKWEEITKRKRSISVIESKKQDWDKDVVILNYDIIGKKQGTGATVRFPELLSKEWKMIIGDEAHFLKNTKSIRAKAFKKIAKRVGRVNLLTGTMIMNKPIELWNLLTIIRKSESVSKHWKAFAETYCDGHKTKFGYYSSGATNVLGLNKKLRECCYIRREKRDLLKELPEVTKQIIQMPITNKKELDRATDDLIQFIEETKGEDFAEKAMSAEHLVRLSLLRKLAIEGKTKAIIQYLKDWKEGEEKLLVFGWHREALEILSEKFQCPLIAGGMSSKKKREIVKSWTKSNDIFLFANMQSVGTGTDNLQDASSNMLILELPWRPSDLEQVIGRLDRSGQKNAVTVTFGLNLNTIDNEMWEMLTEKEVVTEAVNKGIDIEKSSGGMRIVLEKLLKNHK